MVNIICFNFILNIKECIVINLGNENLRLSEKSKNIMFILVSRCIFFGWVNIDNSCGFVSMLVNR